MTRSMDPQPPEGRGRSSLRRWKQLSNARSFISTVKKGAKATPLQLPPEVGPIEPKFIQSTDPWDRMHSPPLLEECRSILQSSAKARTDRDCQRILDMLKHVEFLRSFPMELRLRLCKTMTYVPVPYAGTDVILQGDIGDCMYIILVGSVLVSVRRDITRDTLIRERPAPGTPEPPHDVIAFMHAGEHFGHVALNESKPRNATVTTGEPNCVFLRIHADHYRIARDAEVEAQRSKLDFLGSMAVFRNISEAGLVQIANKCFSERVGAGAALWRDHSEPDFLRFFPIVYHGEVLAVQRVDAGASAGGNKTSRALSQSAPGENNALGVCTFAPGATILEPGMLPETNPQAGAVRIQRRTTSMVTLTPCEILWMTKGDFEKCLEDTPGLAASMGEWVVRFPSPTQALKLWRERVLWESYKIDLRDESILTAKHREQASSANVPRHSRQRREQTSPRSTAASRPSQSPTATLVSMHHILPREFQPNVVLPYRFPQDYRTLSVNESMNGDEWSSPAVAPPRQLYQILKHSNMTPRAQAQATRKARVPCRPRIDCKAKSSTLPRNKTKIDGHPSPRSPPPNTGHSSTNSDGQTSSTASPSNGSESPEADEPEIGEGEEGERFRKSDEAREADSVADRGQQQEEDSAGAEGTIRRAATSEGVLVGVVVEQG